MNNKTERNFAREERDIWISDLAWYYHTQTNDGKIK